MSLYPVLDATALVFFDATPSFSHAAARLQRRFRLIGCRTLSGADAAAAGVAAAGMCVATAWDVSTEDGDKLAPAMLDAMRLVLGSETKPIVGSVRGDCPEGTVIAGPIVDKALAKKLQLVPTEEPPDPTAPAAPAGRAGSSARADAGAPPAPPAASSSGGKSAAAASPKSAAPPKAAAPRVLALSIARTKGGGVRLTIERLKNGAKGAAGAPAAGSKPGKDVKDKVAKKEKDGPDSGAPASSSATMAAPASKAENRGKAAATGKAAGDAVMYRSLADRVAMQSVLRPNTYMHPEKTSALRAFLYHGGRTPWYAAIP